MKPSKLKKKQLDALIAVTEAELAEAENNPKSPDSECYQHPSELRKLIKELKKLRKDKEPKTP